MIDTEKKIEELEKVLAEKEELLSYIPPKTNVKNNDVKIKGAEYVTYDEVCQEITKIQKELMNLKTKKCKIYELERKIGYYKNRICENQEEIMNLKKHHEKLDIANIKTQKNIEELKKELEEAKKQIPDFSEETYLQYKKYFELENELNIESKSRDEKNEMKVFLKKKEELEKELCCLYKEEAKLKQELCLLHAEQEKLEKELAKENI